MADLDEGDVAISICLPVDDIVFPVDLAVIEEDVLPCVWNIESQILQVVHQLERKDKITQQFVIRNEGPGVVQSNQK